MSIDFPDDICWHVERELFLSPGSEGLRVYCALAVISSRWYSCMIKC